MRLFHWILAIAFLVWSEKGLAQTQHERNVAAKIRHELDAAFKIVGEIKTSTRIQSALAQVTAARDEPGHSTDESLRDAEYYLHGLYGASARDWAHAYGALLAPAYNAVKWAAFRCKDAGRPELEAFLRTNPANPVSAPGGAVWAHRGLRDGWSIDGVSDTKERPNGHGLVLPALDSVASCSLLPITSPLLGTKWSLTWNVDNSTSTIYPIEFTSAGRLVRINPRTGASDASSGIANTWKQDGTLVSFGINNNFARFNGSFESEDVLSGVAAANGGETWKWRAVRRP